jgi:hypothetical protein
MGMDPAENEIWTHFDGVENRLTTVLKKSKPHCWQKNKDSYSTFLLFGGSFNLSIITKTKLARTNSYTGQKKSDCRITSHEISLIVL